MADPAALDDPVPPASEPPNRARRAVTVAILVTLIVSMVFLAFVSGRGVIRTAPDVRPLPSVVAAPTPGSRLAVLDASGHLATTDASGSAVVPYGDSGITFSFPAWSPDGSRIAVIGQRDDDTAVYAFTTHGVGSAAAEPTIVYDSTDRPPFYLYWSPDGRQLTFLTSEPDGLALRLAPANASAPATIVRQGAPMYWAWADPARLLVHSGGLATDGFFGEIGVDGRSVEPAIIEPGGFRAPAVTGDGRYRAFVAPGDGGLQRIEVEARDRSNPHTLDVFGAAAIAFAPVTNELAFIAPAQAGREAPLPVGPLRLMDAVSGEVRTLLAGSVVGFFWSPDGATIAALEIIGPGDQTIATAGRTLTVASRPRPAAVAPPSPAPGLGVRLVFVGAGTGSIRSQREIRVSDAFVMQLLPYFDQYALSHRFWSLDGASLVIPVVADDGTTELEVIRADGTGARALTTGVIGFWSP
jgi:TolB protein